MAISLAAPVVVAASMRKRPIQKISRKTLTALRALLAVP